MILAAHSLAQAASTTSLSSSIVDIMALTTTRQTMSRLSPEQLAQYLPKPSPDQLLQRGIEDTLMLISALPETAEEKVIIDLGEGAGWFEIQCNQLELFMKLEELVEKLSPERKTTIINGLHPAMSVQERKALKLVLERGLRRNVVPRPLNVRKVSRDQAHEQNAEGRVTAKLYTVPPKVEVEELVFLELTADEMTLREGQLVAAQVEQSGILDFASSAASTTTAESKRRRQEIANMFTLAAKKLQVQGSSSGLESPVHSPTLKEGLHLIKTATSALRAYTDVTPREVVVRPREGPIWPSQETPLSNEQSVRSSEQTARSGEQPPRASGQSSRSNDLHTPVQALETTKPKISTPLIEQASPPPVSPEEPSIRPRSEPANTAPRSNTRPWPDSFFTSPRAAPAPPRSVSLPQPTLPPPPPPPPLPPKEQPPPVISHSQTNSDSSHTTQPSPTQTPTPAPASDGRKGSISAARAGIADRVRRQQMEAMRGNLPYTRSSVAQTWRSSGSSRRSRPASALGVMEEEQVEEKNVDDGGGERKSGHGDASGM